MKAITRNGNLYTVRFPYEQSLVDVISDLPTAAWVSKYSLWTVSKHYEADLIEFAKSYGFPLDAFVEHNYEKPKQIARRIYRMKNYAVIDFEYNEEVIEAIRSLPGKKWDSKQKFWTAQVGPELMQFAYRFSFDIEEGIKKEIEGNISSAASRLESSSATDAEINVPGLTGELMPYQKAGVRYATETRRCFIADQMGLGKTIQAIASIEKENAYPVLIVCPKSLKENWSREWKKWVPNRTVSILNSKDEVTKADVIIINYDIITKFVGALKFVGLNGLICDESHYVKNSSAARTKNIMQISKYIPQSGMILLLSGTPITNAPQEIVSQLDILGVLGKFGGKWAFLKRYTGAYYNGYHWDTSGASNTNELNLKLRQICYIRRVKDEVLKELPEKSRNIVIVSGSKTEMIAYNKAEKDLVSFLTENGYKASDSAQHLQKTGVLKRLASEAKMESACEWIDNFLESTDRKLVVFAHNVSIVDELSKKYGGLRVSGRDDSDARQHAIDSFQNNPDSRVIVLNLQAGAVGITLTAASDVLFVQMGWHPAEHDQAEDRCHRIGQKNNVQAYYLICAGTIDEDIYDLIQQKRSVVDAVTDGNTEVSHSVLADLMRRISQRSSVN
jgi:SWI/SNF-related matrix-associated actin-dependent regulator of chromatin subfamily A-like protein 1